MQCTCAFMGEWQLWWMDERCSSRPCIIKQEDRECLAFSSSIMSLHFRETARDHLWFALLRFAKLYFNAGGHDFMTVARDRGKVCAVCADFAR